MTKQVICKMYREIRKLVVYVLLLLLIPIAFCTMNIVSSTFTYNTQHIFMWSVFIICGIMLLEMVVSNCLSFQDKRINRFRIAKTSFILTQVILSLMAYGVILYDNIGIENQKYVFEHDRTLMVRILSALDQDESFSYEDPVYFCVITSNSDVDHDFANFMFNDSDDELYQIAFPDSTTNLWCYGDASPRNHMRMIEGVKFNSVSQEIADSIVSDNNIIETHMNMKPWEFDIIKPSNSEVYIIVIKAVIPPLYS